MKLWIDCEFNGFRGDLISMALIDENGRFWYEVLPCDSPCAWVGENVMTVLCKAPTSLAAMQSSLQEFLNPYQAIHLVADWPEDLMHFCRVLITGPGQRIDTPPTTMEIRRDLSSLQSEVPHNALADAVALKLMATGYDARKAAEA